ncbi:hypothetical protein, partial [Litoreibacter halocynthiae]|uniref:hypothetical protein n=1 Tax=Litoreibacter halocynthiae TaxID=1242689 RepID=UPI00248F5E33
PPSIGLTILHLQRRSALQAQLQQSLHVFKGGFGPMHDWQTDALIGNAAPYPMSAVSPNHLQTKQFHTV